MEQLSADVVVPSHCPVTRDDDGTWNLSGHAEVVAAACDPVTFSSRVSHHLHVPNGMDGEEHARFRALIDRYLAPQRVARFGSCFRQIALTLIRSLPFDREPVEAVGEIGARFAVRAQSAWLGWPAELEPTLIRWMVDNRETAHSTDPEMAAAVAERFDLIIGSLIDARRKAGSGAPADITTQLLGERIEGRPLTDPEIVSVLRNWTAGDLGTIASCIGVVIQRLAVDQDLQNRWRNTRPGRAQIEAGIDEILRIDDPFTYNRRITTADVEVGDHMIGRGERVHLNWADANRDLRVMGDPDAFRPLENASSNVVYGIGSHVCPGRALATLQQRVVVEELLAATSSIELAPGSEPVRELPPYGGYRTLPVLLVP